MTPIEDQKNAAHKDESILPILLVEDDEVLNNLFRDSLVEAGFAVTSVVNGSDALEYIKNDQNVLLLLDLALPDMDGRKVIRKIIELQLDIPFIVMTGQGDEETAVEIMKMGARDYIIKDIDFHGRLVPVVQRVCKEIWTERKLLLTEKMVQEHSAAFQEQSKRFHNFFEMASDALFICDSDCRIMDINKHASESLGYSRKELLQLTVSDFVVSHSREQILGILAGIEKEKHIIMEAMHKRKDGSVFPVEVNLGIFQEHEPKLILAIVRDISERKLADEQLRESEERFRLLYEKAPVSYQSLDENGCLIEVNEKWLEKFGYTRDEVIGRSCGDFIDPEWQDHFKENFPRFKDIGEILGVEFNMLRKDGSAMLVSVNGKISRHPDGSFKQTHCILHDITEKRRAEEELKRHRDHLEEDVQERTRKLSTLVKAMTGRELRMAELKNVIKKLRAQLEEAGIEPVVDDPLGKIDDQTP